MSVSYTKTNWVNGSTKLNADNMNHIEKGIGDLVTEVNLLQLKLANWNISFSLTNGLNSSDYRINFMISLEEGVVPGTLMDLEPYVPQSANVLLYGMPVSVYNSEVGGPESLGTGLMSVNNGDFYFAIHCNDVSEEIVATDAESTLFYAEQLPMQ